MSVRKMARMSCVMPAAALLLAALAGCTAASPTPSSLPAAPPSTTATRSAPASIATCTPDAPESWSTTPSNFAHQRIAQALGVTQDSVRRGRFGTATCTPPLSINQIGSGNAPVVTVSGIGELCLAIGTQDDPRQEGTTTKIMAICPASTTT